MNVSGTAEDEISYKIRLVFPPILMVLGIPGNILSIIVLYRLRKTQPSTYLVCLAVSDLILLSLWEVFDWVGSVFKINFQDKYGIFCRIQTFGYFSGVQVSSWMLVLVTLERVCSVLYPHKVRTFFSPFRSLLSVMLTALCIAGFNVKFLFGIQNISPDRYCFDSDNFDYFYVQVWPWIYLNTGFFVPCIILICGNIIIVVTLWRKSTTEPSSLPQDTVTEMYRNKASVVTKRVIILNSVFIICISPICVYVIVNLFGWPGSELLKTILTMLMLVNNSINFFLYILIGSRFRRELFLVLSACSRCIHKTKCEELSESANTRF